MKVALSGFPERYGLPGRPATGSPSALDAYRQTQFLLGEELGLFERAMNAQLLIVADNKRARGPGAAALLSIWSRAFSHLSDACALLCSGSYASCAPLLRTALDCVAVERSLVADGFNEYEEWLAEAVSQAREQQALALELGRYRAGSVLAEDVRLGRLYRLLTDLSMPHFGSTALQVAPDTNLQKMTMAFADSAFHLGWAQLVSGWMLVITSAQTATALSAGVLDASEAVAEEWDTLAGETERLLSSPARCRVEEADGRFLFLNFRRTASGQPKRVML